MRFRTYLFPRSHDGGSVSHRLIMRRALAAAACLAILASAHPATAAAVTLGTDIICGQTASDRALDISDLPDITAPRAIIMDSDGEVYFERDADEQVHIASLTKIMTSIVALENADPDTTITVDATAAAIGESTAYLLEGDTLSLSDALKALLVPSGNDAAWSIAATVGAMIDPKASDPVDAFIDAMNNKAAELGLDALFANPHGLDFDEWAGDMHASARDVVTLVSYAMRYDAFREAFGSGADSLTVTGANGAARTTTFPVRNLILGQGGNIGGKTGVTPEAGTCFAGAFADGGTELYVVVLGCDSSETRFADTLALAQWYFAHCRTVPAVETRQTTMEGQPLVARAPITDWVDKTVDVTVSEEDAEATVTAFDLKGPLDVHVSCDELSGAVDAGQEVGELVLSQDGVELTSVPLVAAESVKAPSPIEWALVRFDRFIRFFTGEPKVAATELIAEAPEL